MRAESPGCASGLLIPPLAVLLVAAVLSSLAFRQSPQPANLGADNQGATALSAIFTPEVQHWGPSILQWAAAADLDPNLVATVMQIESCGDPFARSTAGAIGLFQVMPFHFANGDDSYFPDTNAARGLAYLGRSLNAADADVHLALAGYNGGLALISSPQSDWPSESIRYAYWGAGIYADARDDAAHSARLDDWLAAGGASLCRAAARHLNIGF